METKTRAGVALRNYLCGIDLLPAKGTYAALVDEGDVPGEWR